MAKAPFPVQPVLTAIARMYANQAYIADQVLPRKPVGSEVFKYMEYVKDERFTIPDTKVGRTGKPNELEFGATEKEASTEDYGLEAPIPQKDLEQSAPNYNPLQVHTEGLAELIALDREKRVADLVFAAATYPSGNKTTLSGTDQWNDTSNSTPIDDILSALDSMMVPANVLVLGQAVWTKLRTHPQIAKAIHGNSGDTDIVTRAQVAALFELQEIVVGTGWVNTAKPGQTASYARLWGKHASLIHRNPQAHTQAGITFGLTAQWGDRVAGSWEDRDIGLRGGTRVRVGEAVKELVIASDAGYFFENAVA